MSAAEREFYQDWQRELSRDPAYFEWLDKTQAEQQTQQEKEQHEYESEIQE